MRSRLSQNNNSRMRSHRPVCSPKRTRRRSSSRRPRLTSLREAESREPFDRLLREKLSLVSCTSDKRLNQKTELLLHDTHRLKEHLPMFWILCWNVVFHKSSLMISGIRSPLKPVELRIFTPHLDSSVHEVDRDNDKGRLVGIPLAWERLRQSDTSECPLLCSHSGATAVPAAPLPSSANMRNRGPE